MSNSCSPASFIDVSAFHKLSKFSWWNLARKLLLCIFHIQKISRILIFCQHINLIRAFGIRTVVFYLVILKQFDRLRPVFILWIKSLRFDLEFYISQEGRRFFYFDKIYLLWIIQAERCDHLIISYFLFQQSNSITTFVLLTAIASHLDGFGQNPSDKLPVIPLFGLFKDPKLQSQFRCVLSSAVLYYVIL